MNIQKELPAFFDKQEISGSKREKKYGILFCKKCTGKKNGSVQGSPSSVVVIGNYKTAPYKKHEEEHVNPADIIPGAM